MRKCGLQAKFSTSVLFYSNIEINIQNNNPRVHISVGFDQYSSNAYICSTKSASTDVPWCGIYASGLSPVWR